MEVKKFFGQFGFGLVIKTYTKLKPSDGLSFSEDFRLEIAILFCNRAFIFDVSWIARIFRKDRT